MKIKLKEEEQNDYRMCHELEIFSDDGKKIERHWIGNSEPEDCMIGRDLIDGHDIIKYIQMGYDAALKGEQIDIEYVEEEQESNK